MWRGMTGDEGLFGAGALEKEQPEGVPKGPGGDQSGTRRKAKKKGEMLRKMGTVKPSSRELLGPGVQGRSGAFFKKKKVRWYRNTSVFSRASFQVSPSLFQAPLVAHGEESLSPAAPFQKDL